MRRFAETLVILWWFFGIWLGIAAIIYGAVHGPSWIVIPGAGILLGGFVLMGVDAEDRR